MRLALWISTGRWRPGPWLTAPDRAAVSDALRAGWSLRGASPRWDTVWRPHARALAALRILVLPAAEEGMTLDELRALLRVRLSEAGLPAPAASAAHLRSAEARCMTALAPVWQRALPRSDPSDAGGR